MDAGAHATGGRRGWAGCCARKDEHPPHAVQDRSHGRRRTYAGGIGVEGLGCFWCQRREHLPHLCRTGRMDAGAHMKVG
jgi:hypothetical protein